MSTIDPATTVRGRDEGEHAVFRLRCEWSAIWAPDEAVFDVIGQQGLGLTIVVPDGGGGMRHVPVYLADGPWAQGPPAGASGLARAGHARPALLDPWEPPAPEDAS